MHDRVEMCTQRIPGGALLDGKFIPAVDSPQFSAHDMVETSLTHMLNDTK